MRVWAMTDGSAGMRAQVRALAAALGVACDEKTITVRSPWSWLLNRACDLGLHHLFPVTNEHFSADPAPDLIISCGRKAALVSASLETTAKRIHIQDPQMSRKHFDVVVAMAHDRMHGQNVISVPYALHHITPEKLAQAKNEWQPKFNYLRRPWNAVLIGGSTNKYTLTEAALQKLIADVEAIEGALLVTVSRRTGAEHIRKLAARWRHNGRVYFYAGEGDNPYLGFLACADHVYVTNDSVNMMSEAVAAGKPVSILKLQGHRKTKPARFGEGLSQHSESPQEMMLRVAASVRQMLAMGA